jgi:hypothetical protein
VTPFLTKPLVSFNRLLFAFLNFGVTNGLRYFTKGSTRMLSFRGTNNILSFLKVTSYQRARKTPSSVTIDFGQVQRFPTLFQRVTVCSLFNPNWCIFQQLQSFEKLPPNERSSPTLWTSTGQKPAFVLFLELMTPTTFRSQRLAPGIWINLSTEYCHNRNDMI